MNAQTRAEFFAVGDAVGQSIFEIAAKIVVGLHRDNVRAVRHQQQIFRDLQMMRARVIAAGKEPDRLQPPWVRRIENRQAIAEHVSNIKMIAVPHDLHTVRATADIAVCQMPDTAPDSFGRNCTSRRGLGRLRQVSQTRQSDKGFHLLAPIHPFNPWLIPSRASLPFSGNR